MTIPSQLHPRAAALAVLLAVCVPSAEALVASANAQLDWNAASFDFIAGSGAFANLNTTVEGQRYDTFGVLVGEAYDDAPDWTATLSAFSLYDDGTTQSSAGGGTAGNVLSAHVDITSTLLPVDFGNAWQSGWAWRSGTLEASADGTLLVSVPYSVAISSDDPDLNLDASVYLYASRSNPNAVASYNAYADVFAYVGEQAGAFSFSDSGLLLLAVPLVQGDVFDFGAGASVWMSAPGAPVPLPPTLLLLAGGWLLTLRARRLATT